MSSTKKKRERAGIYVRRSKDRDGATSVARQEKEVRARAKADGVEVEEVYADEGRSGFKKDTERPSFDQALSDLRSGRTSVLYVWKLDRLSRRGIGQVGQVLEDVEAAGARLVSVVDGIDTAESGHRILFALLSEIARQEFENASTRIRRGLLTLPPSLRPSLRPSLLLSPLFSLRAALGSGTPSVSSGASSSVALSSSVPLRTARRSSSILLGGRTVDVRRGREAG